MNTELLERVVAYTLLTLGTGLLERLKDGNRLALHPPHRRSRSRRVFRALLVP